MKLIHWLLFGALVGTLAFDAKADPWDKVDTALGITTAALIITDWGQTRYMAKHPDQFMENNRILGDHPTVSKVNTYFACYLVGGYFLVDWLSPTNRKIVLATIAVVEIQVTRHNKSIGVKFDF